MHDSIDTIEWIIVIILVIIVWAAIVVAIRLPRIEMLSRGVYEELKRIYDELARSNRGQTNSALLCRNCGKSIEANASFCGECGQPATQAINA